MPRKKSEFPSQRLNVFLLREGVTEFDDALDADAKPRRVELAPDSGVEGRFYYEPRAPRPAAWVGFVQPALADDLESVMSASSAGLLVLRASGRLFAVTFGFGKSMLDLSGVVRRFGLKVALNRVDQSHLKSMDTKSFDDLVVTRRTQTSRSSELPSFGVDVSKDLLRAVTGKPSDPTFATALSGADAVVVSVRLPITGLTAKCEELLVAFGETKYKENFDWIDHLTEVAPGDLLTSLDELLLADLLRAAPSTTHMAPPEPIEWDAIDGFAAKIAGARGAEFEELDLEDYLAALGDSLAGLTIGLLKQRRVSVRFNRNGEFDDRWTVYDCLVSEQRVDGALYVLIEGDWFAVDDTLVKRVEAFNSQLAQTEVALPEGKKGEAEDLYNKRAAPETSTELLVLDKKLPRPGGGTSGIEPCDLLTAHGEFIHVKRKSRSSTLSHLFAQGSISALALLDDGEYRSRVRTAIVERAGTRDPGPWLSAVPELAPSGYASTLRVSYVVIVGSDKPGLQWLPFFSQLNLMQHARPLRNAGVTVTVTRIGVASGEG